MNVTLNPDVFEMLQAVAQNDSDDVNEMVQTICQQLNDALNTAQTIIQMLEQCDDSKKISDERNKIYGVLTSSIIGDLIKIGNEVKSQQQTETSNPNLKMELTFRSQQIQSHLDDFSHSVFKKIEMTLQKLANMENFIKDNITDHSLKPDTSLPNENDLLINEISNKFQCLEEEIPNKIDNIVIDNSKYHQLLTLIVQKINCQNEEILNSIDILLSKKILFDQVVDNLSCTESTVISIVHDLIQSSSQLHEIAAFLNTDKSKIMNALSNLKEKAKSSSDIADISRFKNENDSLLMANQQLIEEKDRLLKRVAQLQIDSTQRNAQMKQPNLSYSRYDYLFSAAPIGNVMNEPSTDFEEVLRTKNEIISTLNYQIQDTLDSLQKITENKSNEIESLKEQNMNIELEKGQIEKRNHLLQKELNQLKASLDSEDKNLLLNSLCSSLNCQSQNELPFKISKMKDEILSLRVKITSSLSEKVDTFGQQSAPKNPNSDQIFGLKQRLAEATDQVSALQQQISTMKTENSKILNDNNILYRQIQTFRDNENDFKEENSKRQREVKNSQMAIDRLQMEASKSNLLNKELNGRLEKYEKEFNKIAGKVNRFAILHNDKESICNSIQLLFMQFTVNEFSEDAVDRLLRSIEETTGSSKIDVNRIQKSAFDLQKRMQNLLRQINNGLAKLLEKTLATCQTFEKSKSDLLDTISELREELLEYQENDYAVPYASLQSAFRQLQEKYDLMTRNNNNNNNNNNNFMHRNQNPMIPSAVTPTRNVSMGSRTSLSPSDGVLANTIRQNYERTKDGHLF